jgi:hypothetical protein
MRTSSDAESDFQITELNMQTKNKAKSDGRSVCEGRLKVDGIGCLKGEGDGEEQRRRCDSSSRARDARTSG